MRHCALYLALADHHIGMMLVELGLGDAGGGIKVVVGESRVQDFVCPSHFFFTGSR